MSTIITLEYIFFCMFLLSGPVAGPDGGIINKMTVGQHEEADGHSRETKPSRLMTYNQLDIVNFRDNGFPADERSTNILIPSGNIVYGATSGDKCHIFRFDPSTKKAESLASIEGPNTVFKGMVKNGSDLYVGTMLTQPQLWWEGRRRGGSLEELDANLYQVDDSWNTGHLYHLADIESANPKLTDLGVPVKGQGIYTMAMDSKRELIYGITSPHGRFFIYNIRTRKTEEISFGKTLSEVSNHRVAVVEVVKDLTDFLPGEVESFGKLPARALHVMSDGTVYTSGWDGRLLKYDPAIEKPQERFSTVGYIPCVSGRQYQNRVDEIVEHNGKLWIGSSDGYIFRYDPEANEITNHGKPVRAVENVGMTFSTLDGMLYGISGGNLEGVARFWSLDTQRSGYEVDYPAVVGFAKKPMGDIVCLSNGTIVMAETGRVANLWVLSPGTPKAWEKTGFKEPFYLPNQRPEPRYTLGGVTKKLEAEAYPIPSEMQGGSGYTAIEFDAEGKVYVGTAYYGFYGSFNQLNPKTHAWKQIFRTDELTHQYARGASAPGKIHTKLRRGADGKIYGGMKQGWEFIFNSRPDQGEGPEGVRGNSYTSHFFSYDPKTNVARDLGPGYRHEGMISFSVDTERGYIYSVSDPSVHFLVLDLKTERVWNAGPIAGLYPSRYMAIDEATGRVYHPGEVTPLGRNFMTVWDPEEFRLRDYEIIADGDLKYRHSYTIASGPVGSHKLYGSNWTPDAWEMDLRVTEEGTLHVRKICSVAEESFEYQGYMGCIARGPDNKMYWAASVDEEGAMSVFSWDPRKEKRTYLGSLTLGGEWLTNVVLQGIALDDKGNLALHCLYLKLTPQQQKLAHWQPGTEYKDYQEKPHFLGAPYHKKGTYYSVVYIKNATAVK